jgi:hypothetical protein
MYCSACGHEATVDVNYCKRCGNILSPQATMQSRPISLTGPSWAMALTVMVMVGIIFEAVVKMAQIGVGSVALTWIVIAGLGTVVALVAMIFRQFARIVANNQQQPTETRVKQVAPPELYRAQPEMLPGPLPSVTEHTTRAFAPAYRDPAQHQK